MWGTSHPMKLSEWGYVVFIPPWFFLLPFTIIFWYYKVPKLFLCLLNFIFIRPTGFARECSTNRVLIHELVKWVMIFLDFSIQPKTRLTMVWPMSLRKRGGGVWNHYATYGAYYIAPIYCNLFDPLDPTSHLSINQISNTQNTSNTNTVNSKYGQY